MLSAIELKWRPAPGSCGAFSRLRLSRGPGVYARSIVGLVQSGRIKSHCYSVPLHLYYRPYYRRTGENLRGADDKS